MRKAEKLCYSCGELLKPHQYISILIVVFVILAVLWPLIAHAVTGDEVGFYNSPTEHTALVAPRQSPIAPELPPKRVSGSKSYSGDTNSVLGRIAACESMGNLYARNPRSSAKGKYQFLDGSWNYYGTKLWGSTVGKSVWSEKDQDELAEYVVSINGYQDWEASKYCWG